MVVNPEVKTVACSDPQRGDIVQECYPVFNFKLMVAFGSAFGVDRVSLAPVPGSKKVSQAQGGTDQCIHAGKIGLSLSGLRVGRRTGLQNETYQQAIVSCGTRYRIS